MILFVSIIFCSRLQKTPSECTVRRASSFFVPQRSLRQCRCIQELHPENSKTKLKNTNKKKKPPKTSRKIPPLEGIPNEQSFFAIPLHYLESTNSSFLSFHPTDKADENHLSIFSLTFFPFNSTVASSPLFPTGLKKLSNISF